MRQDDISINKVIEEAGLLSRTAARAKALGGAVKQGASDVGTAIMGKKPSPDAGWRGKYTQGKQDQILKTLSNDIIKDLTKLKLVPAGSPLNPTDLQKSLTQYVSKYTGVGGDQQQAAPAAQAETQAQAAPTPTPEPASTPAPAPAPEPSQTSTPQSAPEPAPEAPKQEEAPAPEAPAPEAPQQSVPIGSTISGKIGNKSYTWRYTSPDEVAQDNKLTPNPSANAENAKWYSLSAPNKKTGQSSMAFDEVLDPKSQESISSAWQKKNTQEQEQQKQTSVPTFESFKNYFWK
jgi:hypothetical protein